MIAQAIAVQNCTKEKKEVKKSPAPVILQKKVAEEIFKKTQQQVASTNLVEVQRKIANHFEILEENNRRIAMLSRIKNTFNHLEDKACTISETEFIANATKQLREATIHQGFNFESAYKKLVESDEKICALNKEVQTLLQTNEAQITKILEEKERQIELEKERKRLEREKLLKGFSGTFSNARNCPCGGYLHFQILLTFEFRDEQLTGTMTFECKPDCGYEEGCYAGTKLAAILEPVLSSNCISFKTTSFYFIQPPYDPSHADFNFLRNFEGTFISHDGTLLRGRFFDDKGHSDGVFNYFKFK